jgi:magnesium transporter
MIRGFAAKEGRLDEVDDISQRFDGVVWIDLFNPSSDEEALIESRIAIDIPTRADMEEIEISSRLYYEEGDAFMTATVPAKSDTDDLQMAPVTFVLTGERLITIRYHDPRAFQTFTQRAQKTSLGCRNGEAVLVALLEAIVDRLADVLERAQREIDNISRSIFERPGATPAKGHDMQKLLQDIGRKGDLTSNIRDSLFTIQRVTGFLGHLTEHSTSLSQKITFLLDATLGMINIQQNGIIKIFSVSAVVFLPPTLIASIYGMNFDFMPEFGWRFGYPLAVGIMVLSAVLPYLYFKHRGWL